MQLIRPERPGAVLPGDGTIHDHVRVPAGVDSLLRRACWDCHSDGTRWPWYARVAPVSWIVARDVRHGRSDLDFSSWSRNPVREPTPRQRVRWICRDIREGIMPPRLYLALHPEARLTEAEQDRICDWSGETLQNLAERSTPLPAAGSSE